MVVEGETQRRIGAWLSKRAVEVQSQWFGGPDGSKSCWPDTKPEHQQRQDNCLHTQHTSATDEGNSSDVGGVLVGARAGGAADGERWTAEVVGLWMSLGGRE